MLQLSRDRRSARDVRPYADTPLADGRARATPTGVVACACYGFMVTRGVANDIASGLDSKVEKRGPSE
ncbi:hypothetical protein CH75_05800 [Dyella jiangningensis]|jgi:hypothetical protein|nr:hypothetical protein CH75_05800 [Dyella jiangningensis]